MAGPPSFEQALRWQAKEPGDVLALVSLGQAYAALGQTREAARAYGSIIDLYPGRADLRRFAGCRLEALSEGGNKLAADSFAKALEQRPDHLRAIACGPMLWPNWAGFPRPLRFSNRAPGSNGPMAASPVAPDSAGRSGPGGSRLAAQGTQPPPRHQQTP